VLLDVMMPEMDGFEFIRRFRQNSVAPIVLLTAKTEAVPESAQYLVTVFGVDHRIQVPDNL